jgi:hypothetical protein
VGTAAKRCRSDPPWEIVGVPQELIDEFSSRSREIDVEKDRLIAEYRAAHGQMPSEKKFVELRAQATLATRPKKQIRSLADLNADWRQRAGKRLGGDAGPNAREWIGPRRPRLMRRLTTALTCR